MQGEHSRRAFILVAAGVSFAMAGCDKKRGDAVVLAKEHIAAVEVQLTPSPFIATVEGTPHADAEEVAAKPLAPDEIVVDQYVMKGAVRGTSKDPRALTNEQWLVTVRLSGGGRQFNVPADRSRWEKLKVGDRVQVRYSEGKYTGTVWGAEIR